MIYKKRFLNYYFVFLTLMIITISNKENFHIDETFSYGLSNHTIVNSYFMTPEIGKKYIPAEEPWLEYFTVQDGKEFDYVNVWKNQTADTHPPMYYAVLHTICSIFSGKFSIWFAGSINIICNLFSLYFVRRIISQLTENKAALECGSIVFILSSNILSMTSFLRMYSMLALFILIISYVFEKTVCSKFIWKQCALIIIISVIGALTHYYFIIWLFFQCLVFGCYLLYHKRWKETLLFMGTMIISGVLVFIIYPPVIAQTLLNKGNKGEQTINNLINISLDTYWEQIHVFYDMINDRLFGGILICIIVEVAVLALWCRIKNCKLKTPAGMQIIKWNLLLIPSIGYFFLISKMAVYNEERYMYPIYSVLILCSISGISVFGEKVLKEKYLWGVLGLTVMIITVNGWRECSWDYLYLKSKDFLKATEQYKNEDCVLIFGLSYRVQPSYNEAKNYKSITLITNDNLSLLDDLECRNAASLIVSIAVDSDVEAILNYIIETYPELDTYQEIGGYNATRTYFLQKAV